jgi:hypothetical protein
LGLFFFGSCLPARPKRLAQAGLYKLALMRNRQGFFIAQTAGMRMQNVQCPTQAGRIRLS